MKTNLIAYILLTTLLIFSGCKSSFEKLRLSSDKDLKLRKAFEFYESGEYQKAQYLLEDLIGQVRMTADAEKVYYYYAYTHYHLKNFTFSSYYFQKFSETYPTGQYAEDALFRSADSYFQLSPNYRLTQEDTESAIEGLQLFINTYPFSEKVVECNKRIDELRKKLEEKALDTAKGYYKRKNYQAAEHSFKNLLIDFPDSDAVEDIRFLIIKSLYKYAQQSVLSKQVERYTACSVACAQFNNKIPESKYLKEIETIKLTADYKIKKIRNEH